ncbi:zinc finger CCCH domain-containing protein 43-like [Triticum dicoccoides]|nr:zinc finger CCCH domain-containing protein 43-like [Triticum dicoccoides]XP_044360583.1 zinc finger CCCH domain-containing protein 43-like [Triticum aestivum]
MPTMNGPPRIFKVSEHQKNLAELTTMFDKTHVTIATSAILGEHIEDPTALFEVEDDNNYLELEDNNDLESNKAPGQKTKEVEKQRAAAIAASPKKKRKQQKNPKVQESRHLANIMAGSTSVTYSTDVPRGHGIKDVIKLAVQSGAKECSDLFFMATKLFMNVDYREMFSALETNEGRLDWLNRMHEEMKKN